jgi:hypothetical protein
MFNYRIQLGLIWPPTRDATREARHQPMSPLEAIRAKCRDCACYQPIEIRFCESLNCAFWLFRPGRRWRALSQGAGNHHGFCDSWAVQDGGCQ